MPTQLKIILFFAFLYAGTANAQLTASFTASPTSGCAPLVVSFASTSTGSPDSTIWDFGYSTGHSVLDSPTTTYSAPGTYTVTLKVKKGSTIKTATATITVYDVPNVNFSASPSKGCPTLHVNFTDGTTLNAPGTGIYNWDFNDGYSSSAQNPSHDFATGTYNITLVVTNSHNCRSSLTKTNFITVYSHPTASFDATNNHFCKPVAAAQFNNYSSGTAPLTYLWRFGDAATSTSSSSPLSHNYLATGTYTVTLIVTDTNGCKDSLVRSNYIQIHKPTANFTVSRTHACLGDTICFTNTSTGAFTSNIWDYSDGTFDFTTSPCHTFTDTGYHAVKLILTDGYCNDTMIKTVHIDSIPNARFVFVPRYPCPAPQTIHFYDSTSGSTTWSWDFGDGSPYGTTKNPTHYYSSNGWYYVTLTVTNANGCKSSFTDTVKIENFYAHILTSRTEGCKPLTINFSENVLTDIPFTSLYTFPLSYSWTFGDGGTGTGGAISHTFYDTGIYTVVLTATNPNGCSTTDTIRVRVGTPPIAAFHALKDTVCPYYVLGFINTSIGADSAEWHFGDGGTSGAFNGVHAYTDTGLYTVTLVAYFHGCPDTIKHNIYVLPPIPIISNNVPCINRETYVFYDTSSILMTTHVWHLGDGSSSTADTVVHTYASTGSYTVTLVAYNSSSGCTDSASYPIAVIDPIASFVAITDTDVCRDKTVSLSGTLTGGIPTTYGWSDYVNGVLKNSYSGTAALSGSITWIADTMKTKGYHTIKVAIKDQNGCFDTASRVNYLLVAKPIAGFSGTPVIGCSPLSVSFNDTSQVVSGTHIAVHSWTYGDGGTAFVSTNPTTYVYNTKGSYSVKLITTDNIGCKDTLQKLNYITALKPAAFFVADRQRPCIGDSVSFNNLSSVDTTHDTLYSVSWDFGDGKTSSAFSPRHAYTATGSYTVRLIVQDVHGCKDTMTRTSYISISKPTAAFTMDDSISICPPLIVHFTNTSSGGAAAYTWDFDDGGGALLANPTHTFNSSKYFKVRLIAMDLNGCYDTAYGHVNIYGYAGGLTYFPLLGCVPLEVSFVASIVSAPTIIWDFSDGVTASASGHTTIKHTYRTPGAYIPKLVLGDGKGCNSESVGLDTIKVDAVIAAFWPKTPCEKDTAHFVDTSKSYFSPVVAWLWSFDGGLSYTSDKSPSKYYDTAGTYPVYLRVINGNGCRDSLNGSFMVHPPPNISAGPDTVICVHDTAILSPSGGVSYIWSSAAFLSCNDCTNPKIAPTDTSYYYVQGTDIFGCKNYDTIKVGLQVKTTSFVDQPPAICQGESIHLHAWGAQLYSWSPPQTLDSPNIATPLASPMDTVNYVMIAKEGSCIPDTELVTLIVHQKPKVNAGNDQTIIGGQTAQLQGRGTYVASYLWSPGATLNCTECADPVSKPLYTTTYQLVGISEYGCKDTDSVTIKVLCDKSQVFIPNAFTPNGDGQNDVFFPRGVAISNIKSFRIYNRWGELVFEKLNININDESNAWDGTFRGIKQDPGVYMYMMDAICESGEEITWKGDVTIIR